jgi:hypothetical protein
MEQTITYHTCTKCGEEKRLTSEFFRKQNSSRGFRSDCLECLRKYARETQRRKREEDPNYSKNSMRKFREDNPEYNSNYLKKWRKENPEKDKIIRKRYLEKNPNQRKEYVSRNRIKIQKINYRSHLKKLKNDEIYRLRIRTRDLILKSFISNSTVKTSKTFKILGCDISFFKKYLEQKFTEGMSWDNMGEWQLDHYYPQSLGKNYEEIVILNHYTNFQPLWARDNNLKSDKIPPNYDEWLKMMKEKLYGS